MDESHFVATYSRRETRTAREIAKVTECILSLVIGHVTTDTDLDSRPSSDSVRRPKTRA